MCDTYLLKGLVVASDFGAHDNTALLVYGVIYLRTDSNSARERCAKSSTHLRLGFFIPLCLIQRRSAQIPPWIVLWTYHASIVVRVLRMATQGILVDFSGQAQGITQRGPRTSWFQCSYIFSKHQPPSKYCRPEPDNIVILKSWIWNLFGQKTAKYLVSNHSCHETSKK